jgi:hypothetical protein
MTDMIQISRSELTRIHALLGAHLGEEAVAALSKTSKTIKAAKAEKKPRANAGQGTAWSAFSSKIRQDHKEEVDAVLADAAVRRKSAKEAGEATPDDTQGAHLHWCSRYKTEHKAEWLAFKSEWEAAHPKGSAAASVADDASVAESAVASEASGAAAGKKARKPQSEETKAAAAHKRAATKAAKTAAPPADAPPASAKDEVVEEAAADLSSAEEEAEDDFLPFSKGGKDYLRWGHLDKDDDEVWAAEGYTWMRNADGSKGAYAGKMVGNKLDSSPAAMAEEPEFE